MTHGNVFDVVPWRFRHILDVQVGWHIEVFNSYIHYNHRIFVVTLLIFIFLQWLRTKSSSTYIIYISITCYIIWPREISKCSLKSYAIPLLPSIITKRLSIPIPFSTYVLHRRPPSLFVVLSVSLKQLILYSLVVLLSKVRTYQILWYFPSSLVTSNASLSVFLKVSIRRLVLFITLITAEIFLCMLHIIFCLITNVLSIHCGIEMCTTSFRYNFRQVLVISNFITDLTFFYTNI